MKMHRVLSIAIMLAAITAATDSWGEEPAPVTTAPIQAANDAAPYVTLDLNAVTFNSPLGFEVAAVEAPLRAQLAIPEDNGVVVTNIPDESEAAKAGLQQYDVLLKVGETAISDPQTFHDAVGKAAGQKISLSVLRQGKPLTLEFTPPSVTARLWLDSFVRPTLQESRYRIGVTLAEADEALRSQLKLASGEGLIVTEVLPESPAAQVGVQRHDVLIKLDGKRLSTVESLNAQVQEVKDRKVTLDLLRRGEETWCELTPQLTNDPAGSVIEARDLSIWLRPTQSQKVLSSWIWQSVGAPNTNVINSYDAVDWAADNSSQPAAEGTPAGRLAELKRQLAAMQKSLEALEASLQPSPPAEPETKE